MNQSLSLLGRQLRDIWKQLGLNQRISIVLAAAVVLGALIGLAAWSSRSHFALLYGRLDEAEAARVVEALTEAKVDYEVRSGGSIFVPSDRVHEVRMQLAGKGIPQGEGVGFEIFDKPNFGVSDFVQRANFLRALQGELARTISQLDVVDAARVMIVLPENRLLIGDQRKPTASVFVRVRGLGTLAASAVNSIRLLVANAVEGLQVNSVSVVDNLGNVLSDNQDDSLAGQSGNQLDARKRVEQYFATKAEEMLETVLGQGQAVVRVAAEINWDTITRFEEKYDPDGQVLRISTIDDEDVASALPGGGGVPGVAANTGQDTNNATAGGVNSSRTKKKTTNNQYEINRTVSNLMQGAGNVERLSAAVFIAQRFEGTGPDRQPVSRSPEELQKLRRIVQSALGIQEGDSASRSDEITLEEMPFNDQPILELSQQLERQERWQYWTGLGQRLIFPALALVALSLFWRAFRRTTSEDATLGLPFPESAGSENGASGGSGAFPRRGAPEAPPIVTVEVLNQLIRENPSNMTQAVRSWMNRGKPVS